MSAMRQRKEDDDMRIVDLRVDNPNNKFAPYQNMATAIVDITEKKGECREEDLLNHGFTKEEIKERYHMANAMAAVDLKLKDYPSFVQPNRSA